MEKLTEKKCKPCEGYGQALTEEEIQNYIDINPHWEFDSIKKMIYQRFQFKNFAKTMGFVNAVAWIANQENHHPTLEVGYNYCIVYFTTHALKGLSPNDFICAAKVEALLK